MTDLGLLSYYLGIQVKQSGEGITLCQSGYAARILDKMGMSECNHKLLRKEPDMNMPNYWLPGWS
jgi:hypothetical protein